MTIADRVIEKCGGVKRTAELIGQTENWVYRWRLDRAKGGTGGNVPRSAQEKLLLASADGRVNVRPADFFDDAPVAGASS